MNYINPKRYKNGDSVPRNLKLEAFSKLTI